MQIQDADGFDRFKNGIIVDNFTGHGIGDVTDKLMDLQKDHRDLTDGSKNKKEVTNNNLFVGSTTDLQRLFMKHDKEQKKVIDATPEE